MQMHDSRTARRSARHHTPIVIEQVRRSQVERAIENLIAILDKMDGDENIEPSMAGFDDRCMDDREGDDEREADEAERGIADLDALNLAEQELSADRLSHYNGDGNQMARALLARIGGAH